MNYIQRAREAVKSVYPTKKWAKRVDTMSDDQVVALYMRFRLQAKL